MIPTPTTTNVERLCAPACMTYEKRPIRQISRNMQEFQAAICELADAVAGSARITAYSGLGDGSIPTSGLPTIRELSRAGPNRNAVCGHRYGGRCPSLAFPAVSNLR